VSYDHLPQAARVHQAFGARVRRHRERHGWSARELALRAGMSANTIPRIEAGNGTPLGYAVVICETLGVSLAEMTGPVECARCDGAPPAGFRCTECGTECGTEGEVPS
jgi:ribosome-binding protein aMBF1 (putative translation factor)